MLSDDQSANSQYGSCGPLKDHELWALLINVLTRTAWKHILNNNCTINGSLGLNMIHCIAYCVVYPLIIGT